MPAELTQAIPVIATDAPAARHRRPCIPPSPLHAAAGDADTTVPTVIRARAVGAEAYRREVDDMALATVAALNPENPHLDEAVLAVSQMLDGDGPARLHKAREIVTVVTLLAERADLDRRVAAIGQAIDDRATVRDAFEAANVKHGVAFHFAAIAVEALTKAGRL